MKIMKLLQDVHRDNLSRKLVGQARDLDPSSESDDGQTTKFDPRDNVNAADDVTSNDVTSNDVVQFESFMYWKPILPDIDRDLEKLCDALMSKVNMFTEAAERVDNQENFDESSDDFNEFNFWRMPIQPLSF